MKSQDIVIARPQTVEQISALKAFMKALKINFEMTTAESYDSGFVKKIKESEKEYENGDFVTVEKENFKSFLGLE